MKRVFEGFTNRCNLDCNRPPLFEEGMHQFHINLIDKPNEEGWDIPVRITIEYLPESKSSQATDKPEPGTDKRCENCVNLGCGGPVERGFCGSWQGKPAEPKHIIPSDCVKHTCIKQQENGGSMPEPQGWEQRFDTFWKSYADKEDVLYTWNNCQRRKDELLSFIRAEIERVHAGYAPLISAIEMAFKEADFLPDGRLTRKARAVFEPIRRAEQNKHREIK